MDVLRAVLHKPWREPKNIQVLGFDLRPGLDISIHADVEEARDTELRLAILIQDEKSEAVFEAPFVEPLPLSILFEDCVVDMSSFYNVSIIAKEEENPLLCPMKLLVETIISTQGRLLFERDHKDLEITLWFARWKTRVYCDAGVFKRLKHRDNISV